jgi:hypothetical protein
VANGLNRLSATGDDGGYGDPDADGSTNWEEQLAGTNPHQPDSALRAQARVLDDERVMISWSAVPGRRYAVQWTTNLAEPFRVVAAPGLPRTSESDTEAIELDLPSLARQSTTMFFRIQVVLP